jgi:hypothetical protein
MRRLAAVALVAAIVFPAAACRGTVDTPLATVMVYDTTTHAVDSGQCLLPFGSKLTLQKGGGDYEARVKLSIQKFKGRSFRAGAHTSVCPDGGVITISSLDYQHMDGIFGNTKDPDPPFKSISREYDYQFAGIKGLLKKQTKHGQLQTTDKTALAVARVTLGHDPGLVRVMNPAVVANADHSFGFWSSCTVRTVRLPKPQLSEYTKYKYGVSVEVVGDYKDSGLPVVGANHTLGIYHSWRKASGRDCPDGTLIRIADQQVHQPLLEDFTP